MVQIIVGLTPQRGITKPREEQKNIDYADYVIFKFLHEK